MGVLVSVRFSAADVRSAIVRDGGLRDATLSLAPGVQRDLPSSLVWRRTTAVTQ